MIQISKIKNKISFGPSLRTRSKTQTQKPKNLKTKEHKPVFWFFGSSVFRFLICVFYFWFFIFNFKAFAVNGTAFDPSSTLYTARQLGLGGLSVAFSDDASGVFSNPAGLSKISFPQITAASRKIVLDATQYTLLDWAFPTDWGTFGVGYIGMNTGDSIPTKLDPATSRIIIDPSREATSYSNSVIALSYSKALPLNLSIGANYKKYSQGFSGEIGNAASGFGIDLGITFKPLYWLTLGAVRNITGSSLEWSSGASDSIKGTSKIGGKVELFDQKLNAGIDSDLANSVNSLGIEYFLYKNLAIRAGLNQGANNFGITYGIGLINGGFRFDYAYAQRADIPGETPHYFSLSYIGERVVTVKRTLKLKNPQVIINYPAHRLITDLENIPVSGEAKVTRILDQQSIWTVTGVSSSQEVREVTEEEALVQVSLNNKIYGDGKAGPISSSVALNEGRNVISILGYTSPEALTPTALPVSAEVKVLRFVPFSDTPMSHWAIEPIALSVTLSLVKGYPDDTFRPEKGITRAELVTLLVRSQQVDQDEIMGFSAFSDVPDSHWASKYITYATENNLVTGYPNGTFKPNKVLTRAEGITILSRYAGISEETEAQPPFMDLPEDYWANKYIAPAKTAGLLAYLTAEAFEPSVPFTRAEACEVLYRTKPIQEKVNYWWETGLTSIPSTSEAIPKPQGAITETGTITTTTETTPQETTVTTVESESIITEPATSESQ